MSLEMTPSQPPSQPRRRSTYRAYYVARVKIALKKIWDNFPQVQLMKLSRVLQVVK